MSDKMEAILNTLGNLQEFSPYEQQSDELSEEELMLVSAAQSIPSFHEFLRKCKGPSAK